MSQALYKPLKYVLALLGFQRTRQSRGAAQPTSAVGEGLLLRIRRPWWRTENRAVQTFAADSRIPVGSSLRPAGCSARAAA